MNTYYAPAQFQATGPLGAPQAVYPGSQPAYNYYFAPQTSLHPLQQQQPYYPAQQMQPVPLQPQYVYYQHRPSPMTPCLGSCYPGVSQCWMHRAPGEIRHLPPPPLGRPGQWVQWQTGEVTWLAPSAFE